MPLDSENSAREEIYDARIPDLQKMVLIQHIKLRAFQDEARGIFHNTHWTVLTKLLDISSIKLIFRNFFWIIPCQIT